MEQSQVSEHDSDQRDTRQYIIPEVQALILHKETIVKGRVS